MPKAKALLENAKKLLVQRIAAGSARRGPVSLRQSLAP